MQLLKCYKLFIYCNLIISPANYMDNWKCTGILKGDGSQVSGQHGALSGILGSATAQSALNGAIGR